MPDRGLADDLRGDRLLEAVSDLLGGRAGHGLDNVQRELSTGYRGDRQHALAAVVESAQTPDKEILDVPGNRVSASVKSASAVTSRNSSSTKNGLPCVRSTIARATAVGGVRPDWEEIIAATSSSSGLEPEGLKGPRAAELGECLCERVCLIDLRVPIGAEDQQGRPLGGAHEVPQQRERRRVAPMKVVQDQDQGLLLGGGAQHGSHRLEQHDLFAVRRLGTGADRRRGCRTVGELGQELCERCPAPGHDGAERLGGLSET